MACCGLLLAQDIDDVTPFLEEPNMTVVIDHMQGPDVTKGVDSQEFASLFPDGA
ncbi:hypothetical protein OH492_13420 [Vibrio chagasii]|nr:hypothetical protein [Vibrio chagasii]